ncbi:alkaline phosphatase PhoX [Mastigocladopsis repens]|uniref:alkaline phosphatase PhoX n=1 Tax=Mastigocladopsis repens TaxID=221287 RepID=UPI000302D52E|nr:alkaline phosphatase PhoX [Mastigocladopsis repens]
MSFSRRRFLTLAGATAAGVTAISPLEAFYARIARGEGVTGVGFGSLQPKLPENYAELANTKLGDLSNVSLLELPPGFKYTAISITGQTMSDGNPVPGDHDGMAAFRGPGGSTILVRNHELDDKEDKFGDTGGVRAPASKKYDQINAGGTTTLVVGQDRKLQKHFASLAGTIRNCAGGPTPWKSWISCEETFSTSSTGVLHGYNFEVPATSDIALADPVPLKAMGRFSHEAIAVDPKTGYIYETEDRSNSCFYRFVPAVGIPNAPGQLAKGGTLYALVVKGRSTLNTSNNPNLGGAVGSVKVGEAMPVEWVKIEDVDPVTDTVRVEAQGKGAAIFYRGEGAWYDNGLIYFVCTQGGPAAVDSTRGNGQVWIYNPRKETITLFVEAASSGELLDEPDNITVSPFGDLFLCEDGGGSQFVVGINKKGEIYQFARNALNESEFAGACFSPDGKTLFVNTQSAGITYCIWGPWPESDDDNDDSDDD